MKLSMWMIANRLDSMDLEVHIRDQAPQVLKSARLAYATDCVSVVQSGEDVICFHEEDTIRIKNISLNEGFELVQGVFDFYQDWMDDMQERLAHYEYQQVIDACWTVFHNPMVLINGQRKVLAMSSQYQHEQMDEEWEHLVRCRYTSPLSDHAFRKQEVRVEAGVPQYFEGNAKAAYRSLSCAILFGRDHCGRLSLLERDRTLNYGDRQLLQIVVQMLKLPLAEQFGPNAASSNMDMFSLLLDGRPVAQEDLTRMLSYMNWPEKGSFQLFTIHFAREVDEVVYEVTCDTIRSGLAGCVVLLKKDVIVIIANLEIRQAGHADSLMESTLKGMDAIVSASLSYQNIRDTIFAWKQADYAYASGRGMYPERRQLSFYDYAIDYMLETDSLAESRHAVHPDIEALWQLKTRDGDSKYEMFRAYMYNDRSLIRTSSQLFMHKNTLVYHMKKIHEIVRYDPEDTYTLDYMKTSIRLLDLMDRKA